MKNIHIKNAFRPIVCMLCSMFILIHAGAMCQQNEAILKSGKNKYSKKILYGQASYYANKFHGRKTASGEIFNQQKFTAACNVLPLGTLIRVTNLKNGKTVIVKTNDRLHPKTRRIIDLTRVAARQLGYINRGLTRVKIEIISKKQH